MKKPLITPAPFALMLSRLLRLTCGAACIATLTACGGGAATTPAVTGPDIATPTGPIAGTPATPGTPETGSQMRSNFSATLANLEPLQFTPLGSIPTTAGPFSLWCFLEYSKWVISSSGPKTLATNCFKAPALCGNRIIK